MACARPRPSVPTVRVGTEGRAPRAASAPLLSEKVPRACGTVLRTMPEKGTFSRRVVLADGLVARGPGAPGAPPGLLPHPGACGARGPGLPGSFPGALTRETN